MTYRIRKLTTQDVEVCHDIQHTSHFAQSEFLWTPQMWNFIARTLTDSWVVIDEKDEVIGYTVGLIRNAEEFDGELAYYWMDFCVKKERQNDEAGSSLVDFLKEQYPFQYAYMQEKNHIAIQFAIDKSDWHTDTTIHGHYKDGSNAHLISYP